MTGGGVFHDLAVEAAEHIERGWQEQGACRGKTGLFFTERGENAGPAKALCWSCPVRSTCLEYALVANEHDGVWGGYSPRERRALKRQRRRAA